MEKRKGEAVSMTKHVVSRRTLLRRGVQLPLGGLALAAVVSHGANAADKLCADPKAMDSGQKSIRDSLKYVEKSADAKTTCAACGFFEATPDGCGSCMIFQGPANPNGHCESWSAKS
jgi:hypothetical protein